MLKLFREKYTNESLKILEEKIYQHLEKQEDFVMIFPKEAIAQELSDKVLEQLGVVGDLKLVTFEKILDQKNPHQDIGKYFMDIILRKSIKRLQKEGAIEKESLYLSEGFLIICKQLLSLIRNSDKDLQELRDAVKISSLKNILTILIEYEKEMEEFNIPDPYSFKGFDKNLCEKYKGCHIYIDGFYEFRPVEMEWIQEVSCNPVEIYIHNIGNFSILEKTIADLKEIGFQEEFLEIPQLPFQKLAHSLGIEKEHQTENIHVLMAEDPYLEGKGICQEIKRQRLKGMSFEKMAIGLKNNDQEDLLLYHLEKEKIPYYYRRKVSLMTFSLFKSLKTMIEDYDTVQDFLWSNIGSAIIEPLEEEHAFTLKNLVNLKQYEEISAYKKDQNISQERDQEKIQTHLLELEQWYELSTSGGNFALHEKIIALIKNKRLKAEDFSEKAVYKEVILWLERIKSQFSKILCILSKREYLDFLIEVFEEYKVEENKNFLKGVNIRKIQDIRLSSYDLIFFPQMKDTNYPRKREYHYFFDEHVIKELKNNGVSLHNKKEDQEEDRLDFLTALSSAVKFIFFSYCKGDLPSFYLREIVNKKQEIHLYTVKDFIRPKREHISTVSDLKKYKGIFSKEIKVEKEKPFFLKSRFSTSELETYQNCPAKYNYQYVLGIQSPYIDRRSQETLLLGELCHNILEQYYKRFHREIRQAIDEKYFNWSGKREFVRENLLNHALDLGFNLNLEETRLELELYINHIMKLLLADLKDLQEEGKRFYPSQFESRIEVEHFFKSAGKRQKILITGRIDRIDESTDGESILIDYKLGSGSIKSWKDIEKGKTLQFPIYSLAKDPVSCKYLSIKKEEIHIFYKITEEGKRSFEVSSEEFRNMQENLETSINEILEKIGNREFQEPAEDKRFCDFCEYKRICMERREG